MKKHKREIDDSAPVFYKMCFKTKFDEIGNLSNVWAEMPENKAFPRTLKTLNVFR